ncbi:MAG: CDP-alcohol phosphatidyltransferase family protein [Rhodospirillaceae bacterium]|jgi:archaetidylinositol phosphate synthase|nr:CDP-alcohol phosphatidyltransferase family protein [Rhodospirillaceae bacterium]MBT4463639.1 CDP-alcohol phosphatidyltransferase family protein [Rhodospirillaceae bacterium]MBT5013610.1 CDP-alcohol phosphatidyltransferase family protein [Rhodospirillaceae bacterium]MBT5309591.1 CDP-alcohol phosphatidyltransferase family protein [Rhodospirillaceae bacterium]MBT7354923.1 CDP-alcohol phosphatidyltransferase family protein [Rhodospirillaceae bacterium]
MEKPPWDQQVARVMVRPLVRTPITPNMLTVATAVIALAGAGLFVPGDAYLANWGAGLFVLARFGDHFDGELARQSGKTSKLGYYLDYISGAVSYAALFFCLGLGFMDSALGNWAIVLGLAGAASALISMFLNLGIDQAQDLKDGDAVGYPGFAGFELEDGIYLIAPITWGGYLLEFFTAAGIGAAVYTLWSLATLLRLRKNNQ